MSGDLGPRVVIAAVLDVIACFEYLELLLVGDQSQLEQLLISCPPSLASRLTVHHAPDVVMMDEDPLLALRRKKQSSMWIALSMVRDGRADACVSAGNTGALMAMSKYLLKTFPGIERPAICKALPVLSGRTYMLDMGANLVCSAGQLAEFALMGSVLARATFSEEPQVALLNVGLEEEKGTATVRAAQALLRSDSRIHYAGFIEADQLFSGRTQVIVCDGFAGNIALKASEGASRFVMKKIEANFLTGLWRKLAALFIRPIFSDLRSELNPGRYNGAIFLGLQKTVVKSHGGADRIAFQHALEVAIEQVDQRVPDKIGLQLARTDN